MTKIMPTTAPACKHVELIGNSEYISETSSDSKQLNLKTALNFNQLPIQLLIKFKNWLADSVNIQKVYELSKICLNYIIEKSDHRIRIIISVTVETRNFIGNI